MAVTARHSASTGLSALSTELDVIANNLANINTTAFKTSRANFQDLMYMEKKQAGVENINGDERPMGLYVGLGTQVSGTHKDFTQGSAMNTHRNLDVMISGLGFFQVGVESDLSADGIGYTRAGSFSLNSEGQLVLATDQGRVLEPGIQLDPDTQLDQITITEDGRVLVREPGNQELQQAGQLELAVFINPAGLKEVGENMFIPTDASGTAVTGVPTEGVFGALKQGFLESSNVDPATELVKLIKTQRAFELNSQAIRAADETLQQMNSLRRR